MARARGQYRKFWKAKTKEEDKVAITKVQSVQGQGTPCTSNNVKSKEIGLFPQSKAIQKQNGKKTTAQKRG